MCVNRLYDIVIRKNAFKRCNTLEDLSADPDNAGIVKVVQCSVGVRADCLKQDLGLYVGCPPWGSF